MRKSELVILFSAVFILLSSCKKEGTFSNIEIIGHAGNGLDIVNGLYHDNSYESIELALLTDGCDGVEMDVRLSADGTLWLFHDTELDETTNGTGCVGTSSDSYLSTLHYTSVDHEKLIRLSDVPKSYFVDRRVYIDSRSTVNCTNSFADLDEFLNQMLLFRDACSPTTKIIFETRNSQWELAFSTAGFNTIMYIHNFGEYETLDNDFPSVDIIVVSNETITKEEVAQIHEDGREVIIFGMRSVKSTRDAYRKQPDAILADNLRVAIIEKY